MLLICIISVMIWSQISTEKNFEFAMTSGVNTVHAGYLNLQLTHVSQSELCQSVRKYGKEARLFAYFLCSWNSKFQLKDDGTFLLSVHAKQIWAHMTSQNVTQNSPSHLDLTCTPPWNLLFIQIMTREAH